MLGPQKLPKNDQEPKKNFQDRFSIAKRRKMMNWDPFQEGVADKYPKKRRFSRIWGHFWTTFSRHVASPWPACTVRNKYSKNLSLPMLAAFFARTENHKKRTQKPFKKKALKKETQKLDSEAFAELPGGWKPHILTYKSQHFPAAEAFRKLFIYFCSEMF